MTSFFNDVNPRQTSRSPRGIMRVVVVIAMVLGLAGVMGFAPGTGGELRREAAGVMPIVDAGNYVGTELGERLSNNGGMDLSWPRPEGFDGIWFEKEPYGRREHVVWESQRFVGQPVDIPKLKQGQVKGDFVGLPDICGPVVRERMAELGYLPSKTLESNYEFRYGCNFGNRNVEIWRISMPWTCPWGLRRDIWNRLRSTRSMSCRRAVITWQFLTVCQMSRAQLGGQDFAMKTGSMWRPVLIGWSHSMRSVRSMRSTHK